MGLGQRAVLGKLVAVFAEAAHHVVGGECGFVFAAQHVDAMVGAVELRAHEVGGAGVHAQVAAIGLLLVNHAREQGTRRREEPAAQLRTISNPLISHSVYIHNIFMRVILYLVTQPANIHRQRMPVHNLISAIPQCIQQHIISQKLLLVCP